MEKEKTIASQGDLKENENAQKKTIVKKFLIWFKKSPLTALLLIVFIILAGWLFIKLTITKNRLEKEKIEITKSFENQIDSLTNRSFESVAMIFSWTVRSEMLRQNNENLNQLFTVFVQESGSNLAQLVDLKDNTILISTDKQYEGKKYINLVHLTIEKQKLVADESKIQVLTPIMGMNSIIGLMIVEKNK